LKIACALAKGLTLADERVVDAYGGYCATPSKYLPSPAPVKNTTANTSTTANKTNTTTTAKANTTTANKTTRILATANKTWAINLFVNPDPTAATDDPSVWLAKA